MGRQRQRSEVCCHKPRERQRSPRAPRSPERGMGQIVPQNPQKALTLPHADFGLAATRTVREYISVVLGGLGKLTHPLYQKMVSATEKRHTQNRERRIRKEEGG